MITSVNTTALTVSDMKRSVAFYCDLFGFKVVVELPPPAERQRWDQYHEEVCGIKGAQILVNYLEAPDGKSSLELIEYLKPKKVAPSRRSIEEPGVTIVPFGVKDSKYAVKKLREAGVEVLSDPVPYETDDGVRSFTTYLYDPDSNAICLFEILED